MKLRHIAYGAATCIPGVTRVRVTGTGGTDSARYCYSVWMRHLVLASANGLNGNPGIVAELGPGDSLGIGLAALISGCEKYLAFDVVAYAHTARNLRVFDELVTLFQNRADIPAEDEFPRVKPVLDDYGFPNHILDNQRLTAAMSDDRLKHIRRSITDSGDRHALIEYRVPWFDPLVIESESVDMIYSQAVLEHVDDLENTYRAMRLWLKPHGCVSHQIDFKCHGTADRWNGHWACSDLMWKVIRGKRPYLLNRQPHSVHLALLAKEQFKIVCDKTIQTESKLPRQTLAPRFQSLTDQDLVTSGAFIQAVKTGCRSPAAREQKPDWNTTKQTG